MKTVLLSELANIIGAELCGDDAQVQSVSTDTRTLEPGDLFIALQGERFDAGEFLAQAKQRGAVAAIVPKRISDVGITQLVVEDTLLALGAIAEWHRNQLSLTVVGLTGSVGKTSCKELMASIFGQNGSVHATVGNLNNEIGVPLTLLALSEEHDVAVVEMGAAKLGDIAYLGQLVHPSISLVTTVAAAHLEGFGSVENIATTKAEIYQCISKDGTAVVNLDNEHTRAMLQSLDAKNVVSFSRSDRSATVFAENVEAQESADSKPACYSFRLVTPEDQTQISLSVPGEFMVLNALAAAACAYAAGVDTGNIKRGLEKFAGFAQRMVTHQGIANSLIIDDSYNANPASMRAAVDVLAGMSGHRVLLMGVMAELGSDSKQLHASIGSYARAQGINQLLAVGADAESAVSAFGENAVSCIDHSECIELCREIAVNHEREGNARVCFLAKGSRSAKMENVVAGLSLLEGAS